MSTIIEQQSLSHKAEEEFQLLPNKGFFLHYLSANTNNWKLYQSSSLILDFFM